MLSNSTKKECLAVQTKAGLRNMTKRVLWLSNETWTRECEVPQIIEAGYEVFCPKVCGYGLGESNLSVDYTYDEGLSIPGEDLEYLNKENLYGKVSQHTWEIINKYFGVVFCPPDADIIREYVHLYNGIIVLRFLGDEEGLTCTERLVADCGYHLLYEIGRIKDRFYFAYPNDTYMKDECDLLRGRGLFLPLPLVNAEDSDDRTQILLNCPNLSIDAKANRQFQMFLANMSDPFAVYGEQVVPYQHHEDLILGGEYEHMQNAGVSIDLGLGSTLITEPWAQALYRRIPLLYTKDSCAYPLLKEDSPGYCDSVKTLIAKAKKIHNGDRGLKAKIVRHQADVLSLSEPGVFAEAWKNVFARIEYTATFLENAMPRNKKIGIILTKAYKGGVLEFTKRFIGALHREILKHGAQVELVFAHIDDESYDLNDTFASLRESGIAIRTIGLREMKLTEVNRMLSMAGYLPKNFHGVKEIPTGIVYDDGIHMLMDCDYLINMTYRSGSYQPILPVYPFAVVAHDFIDRYSPIGENFSKIKSSDDDDDENQKKTKKQIAEEKKFAEENNEEIVGKFIRYRREVGPNMINARNADRVFVTSDPGKTDAIQFAMVNKDNVVKLPLLYELIATKAEFRKNSKENDKKYFLWTSNASKHKNHINALKAISEYYRKGGTLKCIMIGDFTQYFDPDSEFKDPFDEDIMNYMLSVRKFISENEQLRNNIDFMGYQTEDVYRKLIQDAAFLIHPGFADNGNGGAIDAACFGVPTLSNDYPAMQYLSDYANIDCQFTDFNDADKASDELIWMEQHFPEKRKKLNYDKIKEHAADNTEEELYNAVSENIGFRTRLLV